MPRQIRRWWRQQCPEWSITGYDELNMREASAHIQNYGQPLLLDQAADEENELGFRTRPEGSSGRVALLLGSRTKEDGIDADRERRAMCQPSPEEGIHVRVRGRRRQHDVRRVTQEGTPESAVCDPFDPIEERNTVLNEADVLRNDDGFAVTLREDHGERAAEIKTIERVNPVCPLRQTVHLGPTGEPPDRYRNPEQIFQEVEAGHPDALVLLSRRVRRNPTGDPAHFGSRIGVSGEEILGDTLNAPEMWGHVAGHEANFHRL